MSIAERRLGFALGQPAVEVLRPDDGDLELWSVTSIIDCLDRPALQGWAANKTADAALDSLGMLAARVEIEGRDEVRRWLASARFRPDRGQLTATALGQVVHAACEEYALTGRRPDLSDLAGMIDAVGKLRAEAVAAEAAVVARMLDRFDEWLARFTPTYLAAEVVVYNLTYGYAGQADAFVEIAGVPVIVDYKSTRDPLDGQGRPKTPYPEAALQIAGYRYAERAAVWRPRRTEKYKRRVYLLSDAEREQAVPVPEVEGGVVIHITPEACEAFPVRCDERVHAAFLYVQEAARWAYDLAKDVVGLPLVAAE